MDMLEQARKRLGSHAHIKCIQGDVGNLQMENESVDTVVSMNGFHAFPDKQKAFHEIWRVLKLFSTVSDGERAKRYPSKTI